MAKHGMFLRGSKSTGSPQRGRQQAVVSQPPARSAGQAPLPNRSPQSEMYDMGAGNNFAQSVEESPQGQSGSTASESGMATLQQSDDSVSLGEELMAQLKDEAGYVGYDIETNEDEDDEGDGSLRAEPGESNGD